MARTEHATSPEHVETYDVQRRERKIPSRTSVSAELALLGIAALLMLAAMASVKAFGDSVVAYVIQILLCLILAAAVPLVSIRSMRLTTEGLKLRSFLRGASHVFHLGGTREQSIEEALYLDAMTVVGDLERTAWRTANRK